MAKARRALVVHTFQGGRFDDHGVDLDVLPELLAYKTILLETAKELWRRKNPDRQRLPRNFEDSLSIKFFEVRDGSAAIPLFREVETEDQLLLIDTQIDELDEAVNLIADAVEAAGGDTTLPPALPSNVLPLFLNYGKTLRKDEWIEQQPMKRPTSVRYTSVVRERLDRWSQSAYEDTVDVIGTVTMARVSRPRMAITLDDGREIEASFNPEHESVITTALKDHACAKVRVEGKAQFWGGQLQKILEVNRVTLLPTGTVPFDAGAKPNWDVFGDILKEIPATVLGKLPTDLAENHDHYIYGAPKKKS
jgi:hypothetical protein